MEAGYDYMLLRGPKRRQPNTLTGIFLVILGSMLITTSLAYYSYTDTAWTGLVSLEAALPGAVSEVQASVQDTSPNPGQQVLSRTAWPERTIAQPAPRENTLGAARSNPVKATIKMAEKPAVEKAGADITVVSTKEMSTVVEGREDAPAPVLTPVEKQADTPTLQPDTLALVEPGSSTVVEAGVEDLATSETGLNPNPLLGEGSIFFNLVQIPEMLKQGRDVFVIAESEEGQYLYRLISSRVVHEQDIRLYDAGGATIHLVSCVPRLVYDHRLIVSGELISQV